MSGSTGTAEGDAAAFDGARRPDRRSEVTSDGIRLAVSEWGDPDAPPLVLAHGGFDFAGTFDVLKIGLILTKHRLVVYLGSSILCDSGLEFQMLLSCE